MKAFSASRHWMTVCCKNSANGELGARVGERKFWPGMPALLAIDEAAVPSLAIPALTGRASWLTSSRAPESPA